MDVTPIATITKIYIYNSAQLMYNLTQDEGKLVNVFVILCHSIKMAHVYIFVS